MREATVTGPVLVEILGVAGSGKSTLATRLTADPEFSRAPFISARNPRHVVYFVRTLPGILPLLAANVWRKPRMTWADYKLMVYVMIWRPMLRRMGSGSVLLLDQGPLYALVRLRAKGLGISSVPSFERWWSRMLTAAIPALTLVVWLDAPDRVLAERINERPQSHAVKGVHAGETTHFIQRYRGLFMEIVGEIGIHGGPGVVECDTSHSTTDEIAERVKEELSARTEPSS